MTSPIAHDRVADELAGAVVGDPAAAVDVDDLDPLLGVERVAERQLSVAGPAPARVDRRDARASSTSGIASAWRAARSSSCSASASA